MQNKHSRKEDDAPPGVEGGYAARMPPHLALSAATCPADLTMMPPAPMILGGNSVENKFSSSYALVLA